jgi:clan AA aspartic protease
MGIVRCPVRLYNDARPEIEEVDANAVVDTGAMNLCIPEHVAIQLRLQKLYEREVVTADGRRHIVPYVGGVRVETQGRGCVTGALVFGNEVLLGAIPMEDMDMVVHPARLTAIPNPENPNIAVSLALGARPVETN